MRTSRYARVLPFLVMAILLLLAAALRLWRLDVLPPGLYGDEAINGVDERMVLHGAGLPIYFMANNGREPLFLYLQALSVAILGYTPLALRLVSALVGIATVGAVYFCALTVFRPSNRALSPQEQAREVTWPALLAAAGAAVSYWALSISRLGFRAVLLPLTSALAIAFFWRAWQGGRRRDYALAGLWLGITLYTYSAARLLPLVLAAFVFLEAIRGLWLRRHAARQAEPLHSWRTHLAGLAVLVGVFLLIAIPLAVTFWHYPDILAGRTEQVSILDRGGSPVEELKTNLVNVARNFYDRGDLELRHNLPGRPVNDPLLAIIFAIGIMAALARIRKPQNQLILLWFVVMLLPTLFSTPAPHTLRAAGALPPLCLLYGLGGAVLIKLASPKGRRGYLAPALLAIVVLVSGTRTAQDYFGRWAVLPSLGHAFTLDQQLAASAAAGILNDGANAKPVLISYRLYSHPQMTFALGLATQAPLPDWASARAGRPEIRYVLNEHLDPAEPMYLLWRDGNRLMEASVDPLQPSDAGALSTVVASGSPDNVIRAGASQADWAELRSGVVPAQVQLRPRHIDVPLDVTFADGMRLTGYSVEPNWLPAGAEPADIRLSLFWELGRQQERGAITPEAFVHLTNAKGVWQTMNGPFNNYLMSWLQTPYTIEDIRVVPVPPDMPAGKARFEVGLYLPSSLSGPGTGKRIDILDSAGKHVADRVDIGTVVINGAPGQADQTGLRPIDARYGNSIRLTGWRISPDNSHPDALKVDFGWQVLGRSASDYTAFVHLIDANGKIVAQHDEPPGGQENPTSRWVPGETIRSTFDLQVPQAVDLKDLTLRAGLYEPVSGKQLPVQMQGSPPSGVEDHGTYLILPVVE